MYPLLTLREFEYLERIQASNTFLYESILQKIKDERATTMVNTLLKMNKNKDEEIPFVERSEILR